MALDVDIFEVNGMKTRRIHNVILEDFDPFPRIGESIKIKRKNYQVLDVIHKLISEDYREVSLLVKKRKTYIM